MPISFKVDNVEISALRDRVMFNSFAGNKSYVVKGFGQELNVTSSSTSFSVTLGTGEAVICGGSMLVEGETPSLTLPANSSGYLVIRVDLSQTGDNICQFKNVNALVQGDINNGTDLIYDLPLYQYKTNSEGVQTLTDKRNRISTSNDGYMKMVTSPVNNNILVSDANGQAKISNKKLTDIYSAGSNVTISNNKINAQVLNAFNLQTLPSNDLNDVKTPAYYNVTSGTLNAPKSNNGTLFVERLNNNYVKQIFNLYFADGKGAQYIRYFREGTWSAWTIITENKVSVLSNTRLDTILTTGMYYVTGGTTARNFPSGVTEGWLVVFNSNPNNDTNANVKQILYRYDGSYQDPINRSDEYNSQVYVRSITKGSSYYGLWQLLSNKYNALNKLVKDLGSDYVMTDGDFSENFPTGFWKINSLKSTGKNAPDRNVGDFYLFKTYNGKQQYATFFLTSPRLDGTFYTGRFWDGAFDGWKAHTPASYDSTTETAVDGGSIKFYKSRNVVQVSFDNVKVNASSTSVLASIPPLFRPKNTSKFSSEGRVLTFKSSGGITITSKTSAQTLNDTFVYIIEEQQNETFI